MNKMAAKGTYPNTVPTWFDKSIPMLDNQTPREAVKTKEGRERLEALLLYYENRQEDMPKNFMRPNVNELRKTLGL